MELLGGQNRFPRSHLSEFFDVPAGCNGIPPNKMFTNFEYIRVFTEYMLSHRKRCSLQVD